MINVELLYKLGLDYASKFDFEMQGELNEFKKFIKSLPDFYKKIEICQIAIQKTYFVYQTLCTYLKNEESMQSTISSYSDQYRFFTNLQMKIGYLYNSIIDYSLLEIENNSNQLDPRIKKYLIQSIKNFDIIFHAKLIEEEELKFNRLHS